MPQHFRCSESLVCSCDSYYYYYYTMFKHVKSFTKVKNRKCERSQCHRRNARSYRAVLSLDLKVGMLTVISEVTVSESLFQTAGAARQKAFLEKLRVAGLHWRMFAPRGLSSIDYCNSVYCGARCQAALLLICYSVQFILAVHGPLALCTTRSDKCRRAESGPLSCHKPSVLTKYDNTLTFHSCSWTAE